MRLTRRTFVVSGLAFSAACSRGGRVEPWLPVDAKFNGCEGG